MYGALFYYKTPILWYHKFDFYITNLIFWYHKIDFLISQNNPDFFLYQNIYFVIPKKYTIVPDYASGVGVGGGWDSEYFPLPILIDVTSC